MPEYSNTRIQVRRGTSSEWASANPVLGEGEPGYDLTNKILKVGDGTSTWSDLPEAGISQEDLDQAIANLIDSAPQTLDTLNEIAAAINDNASFFEAVAYSGGAISQFNNDSNYIVSDNSVANGSDLVTNIISLTQEEYDLITPESGIVYIVSGGSPAHPTISAASSSDNSGRTYIQDIILDSNGHVTGISTATETVVNTDTNNYANSLSFSANTLTLGRLGLGDLTSDIGGDTSPFQKIRLTGSSIQSSNANALYLNRTHSGGLTAMAGGTYPSANDGGLVSAFGGTHAFSPSQVHLYYNNTIRLAADVNGVTVYGTFTNNSDATQKENVVPLSGCLDLINNLNPVSFNFKPEEGLHDRTTVGFIAQEVQQTFSGLPYELGIVREIDYPTVNEGENTSKKILGISETNLVAILTKAVQELTARVEALESQLS